VREIATSRGRRCRRHDVRLTTPFAR